MFGRTAEAGLPATLGTAEDGNPQMKAEEAALNGGAAAEKIG